MTYFHELKPDEIDQIRKATNGNFALGAKRFQDEISIMLGRRAFPGNVWQTEDKKMIKIVVCPLFLGTGSVTAH